jgi:phosphoglycerol geranylgeranyltransferase
MKKQNQIYHKIISEKSSNLKGLAVLLDPDEINYEILPDLIHDCILSKVGYFLVGGSLITNQGIFELVKFIKKYCDIPVVLFPGNSLHIENNADGILLLSLISGRNPDFLIGQHVIAAPILKKSELEILPTGYILIDGGAQTTVSYISNTFPIPNNKPTIAACTAMAGEMMGLKLMYLDAGSGAKCSVSKDMISTVRKSIDCPLIVGGGINTPSKAQEAWEAGADIIVVGNKIEEDPGFISYLGEVLALQNAQVFSN